MSEIAKLVSGPNYNNPKTKQLSNSETNQRVGSPRWFRDWKAQITALSTPSHWLLEISLRNRAAQAQLLVSVEGVAGIVGARVVRCYHVKRESFWSCEALQTRCEWIMRHAYQ